MEATGDWAYLGESAEPCRVLERRSIWGSSTCQVWIPSTGAVLRVREDRLRPVAYGGATAGQHALVYSAAAARIADALERDSLVAPLAGSLIPLPHQIHALSRAMSGDRVRYLLADEVGLGKTIEAGLIMKELKIRGLVRRTLVVAPSGLVLQWVQEMRAHFDEDFRLVIPGSFGTVRQVTGLGERDNLWQLHDQVVCPVDSVKPLESRRGWTPEQVARYNRERFEDLVSAGWDLIVVDESHRLGGSSDQIARYQLGEALGQASPYLLLLSATPHQGKTDAFRRLMSFLDPEAFPGDDAIKQERVAPYVIRTEKRHAIDAAGNALFKPRQTRLLGIDWSQDQADQRALYEAVTEYAREGYNQAIREKQSAVGFLMILMQRLVTSSTRAIRATLERRLEVLELPEGQLSLFGEDIGLDWAGLSGEEQLESVLKARLKGLRSERSEVELLLSAARRCEAAGPDAKARALLDLIHRLEREENDPELKILIFTEFLPTQAMLGEFLSGRGFTVATLNGSMDLEERRAAQQAFASDARVLVSTEAGGEGLNLQFCHIVVNYDLPWNPMRLEQRIGRVDRIGQAHVVRAFNFALEGTVELRVREVLEEKLQRILEDFGVDKLGDVLDSEEAEFGFDELFMDAMLKPDRAEQVAERFADELRQRAAAARSGLKVLGESGPLDPSVARKIGEHQLPFWIERMTLAFLQSRAACGAQVEEQKEGGTYRLRWPDGHTVERAVFRRDAAESSGATLVSLEDPYVREAIARIPTVAPGQPIPAVVVPEISDRVTGIWSLWRISLETTDGREHRVLPIFLSDGGRVLAPTARALWDRLIQPGVEGLPFHPASVNAEEAVQAYTTSRRAAEEHGSPVYRELVAAHAERLQRERAKMEEAFAARQRAISRIGLPQVRQYRLAQLEKERGQWNATLAEKETGVPDLSAIALVRIAAPGAVP